MGNGSLGLILHAEVGLGNLMNAEKHAEHPILDGRADRDLLTPERLAQIVRLALEGIYASVV
jgi:hypothetical protein